MKKLDNVSIRFITNYEGFHNEENLHVHSYHITIENHGNKPFQILTRKWKISNGLNYKKIVEGDGLIGKQPILQVGESFKYSSWCPFPSTVGYMKGTFYGIDVTTQEAISLDVPLMTFMAMESQN